MNDLSYEQRKQALIEEITAAFDGVSREGGVSLSESRVIDDYGSKYERSKARRQDTDTRWQDIADADLYIGFIGYNCLNFMDDIGFRYYLPACMVWCLRHIDDEIDDEIEFESEYSDGSDVLFESVLWALRSNNGTDQHSLSYFGKLTPTQSKSVAHFLKFTEEWEEKRHQEHELEMVRWRREQMALEGYSIAEMDAAEYKPQQLQNESTIALDGYWERFL